MPKAAENALTQLAVGPSAAKTPKQYNSLMKKPSTKDAKAYIVQLLSDDQDLIQTEKRVTREQTQELEFFINNGHWEVLIKNEVFQMLAPQGQVHTLTNTLDNRVKELRTTLTPLGRSDKTRDAYIQILNHIHDLERLKEEILEEFYGKAGKRQISKDSKSKKINF